MLFRSLATQVITQVLKAETFVTNALSVHLNIGQRVAMNTSAVFMSLESTSVVSLTNRIIRQLPNAQIRLPSAVQSLGNQTDRVSLRVRSRIVVHRLLLH